MDIRLYLKILLRWWWLWLLPPLAVGAYGLVTYRAPAQAYALTLRFTAGQPENPPAGALYDPNYYRWVTSEYIVGGLKDWARTGAFAEAVRQELLAAGRDVPAAAIAGAIAADNARSVLVVSLTWGDPEALAALAQAATAVLQERNGEIFPQLGGQPARVVPLDSLSAAPVPPSLRARLDLPLKAAVALAAGLGLALLAHYLDPFVRDRDEAEALGLRVVAEIPSRGERRKTG